MHWDRQRNHGLLEIRTKDVVRCTSRRGTSVPQGTGINERSTVLLVKTRCARGEERPIGRA